LIETSLHGKTLAYAVIGIGINANVRIADFPELLPSATSLSDKLGQEVSRLEIIRQLLVEMERLYQNSAESVFQEWRARLVTLGKQVRVRSGETIEEGIAESVAADGSLLLRRPDGSLATIVAGDATLRQ
ncbi:MAG: biotin--[acetyl-CoA-carboxylase] ligase, partial [Chloroflexota bacterium]|nr:biotin--[acetyl-CoA-carboxylase] ligase [Chloroflexota bacterium]